MSSKSNSAWKHLIVVWLLAILGGCQSDTPAPAKPDPDPVPNLETSLPEVSESKSERPAISSEKPLSIPGGEVIRVHGKILVPMSQTYSGEPVVVLFCKPGHSREGHINPRVAFPDEQQENIVPFHADVETPSQPGSYELWVLVEREPASMRKVSVTSK